METAYVIVNEAGASVYSTSDIGREEFPEFDATLRGTISIGRRLQDPLSELVKINPQNVGVGLYQHDIKQKHLQQSLDDVVESCVNHVGVDVNTASVALLALRVGPEPADRPPRGRTSPAARAVQEPPAAPRCLGRGRGFVHAVAGFLKITGGDNPLDATWIHPESYVAAEKAIWRSSSAGRG